MDITEIVERLDRSVSTHRLLDHPFYQAWAEGTLSREDLRFYAGQYWRQVEAFPGYLEVLADRLPDSDAKVSVLDNLADERDDDHPALWLRFAEALGASRGEVTSAAVEPETQNCVQSFTRGAADRSTLFALGMLYRYESQTPEVSATKIEGLKAHYGIDGPGLDYFELHGELDVEHSRELAAAIEELATDEDDLAEAEEGAMVGAQAVFELLDGVARVRAIA